MRSTTHYAHGLNIKSELFFPEFPIKQTSEIDVIIRFGITNLFNDSNKNFHEVYLSKFTHIKISSCNLINLFWNDIQIFTIKNNEIIINPNTNLDLNYIKFLLFGYGFSILLYLKGRLVLHANAVDMDNSAVVISGVSGIGKSTLSFAFHKKGYKLLCDDVLSMDIGKKFQTVYPSFPRIKLWPDVIENFGEDSGMIPKIHDKTSKRFYNVSGNFSDIEKQIRAIYFIKVTGNIKIKEMNPQKALMELIKSSYCYKLLDNHEIAENLSQCSAIVNKVPVKMLEVEKSYKSLNKLVEIVENDILKK